MDYLFNTLKKHADEITARPSLFTDHYQHCINYGFVKLQEYCTKIDDSRLYSAAVALNPCRKFTYFEQAWGNKPGGRDAITAARRMTRELYEQYLTHVELPAPAASTLLINSDSFDEDEE